LIWKLSYFQTHVKAISVFSSVPYTGVAANILLAAKEDGIEEADDLVVDALRHSLVRAITVLDTHPILVPIPSTKSANRRRGRSFLPDIADRVGTSGDLKINHLLRHNRSVQDQSRLNAHARFDNLSGALSVISRAGRAREVLLIDDLVTTGATLNEANRVLTIAGFTVQGAITACVALPLR
jgi:predicted amidophosphoribosyltransferase